MAHARPPVSLVANIIMRDAIRAIYSDSVHGRTLVIISEVPGFIMLGSGIIFLFFSISLSFYTLLFYCSLICDLFILTFLLIIICTYLYVVII